MPDPADEGPVAQPRRPGHLYAVGRIRRGDQTVGVTEGEEEARGDGRAACTSPVGIGTPIGAAMSPDIGLSSCDCRPTTGVLYDSGLKQSTCVSGRLLGAPALTQGLCVNLRLERLRRLPRRLSFSYLIISVLWFYR
jgi:hypothetical protein